MNIKKILLATLITGSGLSMAAQAVTYNTTTIANNLRDISSAAAIVSGDDISVSVTLPFIFNFYGNNYTNANVSTNGFISFSSNRQGCCDGETFPGATIGAAIVPAWTDWITSVKGKTLGFIGSREYVVSWVGSEYYYGTPANFQAILHEGTNNIEFQYGSTSVRGHTLTAGIENNASEGINISTSNLSGNGYLISAVPEPESYTMLLAGLGLMGFTLRRRKTS